jgi:pimeloyl-ACP methyl ester carboxylesterase
MTLTWTGNGRGTAVLLHGMMSLSATWWRIGPALAERGWDVAALDLAAHGGNRLGRPLTADALVRSVTDQLSAPVDLLVGHSMGAATAITAVVEQPELARAVVLEDPPGGRADAASAEELAHGVELDAETARTDRDRLVRRSRAEHPGWADQDVEQDVVGIERADAEAVSSGLRTGLRGWDIPGLVGAARIPVLLLAAAGSGSALVGAARDGVRAALPPDRFVELAGGHCLHRDVPDRWLAAVDAFTAEVLPPAR